MAGDAWARPTSSIPHSEAPSRSLRLRLRTNVSETQLRVFHEALRRYGDLSARPPADWFDAFDRLRMLLETDSVTRMSEGRRVIFLDEFPWFATKRSDFFVAFADFWNAWASEQSDIMVIVCGSSTSWFIKYLFKNTGSMYNRLTRRLSVEPFTLHEVELMASALDLGWSRQTILEAHLVFGGLPYYFDLMDRRFSLAENIDALCFGARAPLRDEVTHLMETTLSDTPLYRETLRILSETKAGLSRSKLVERLGGEGGGVSRALDGLKKCGYIRRYRNSYEKGRPTIFQLIDPFLPFSLKFTEDSPIEGWSGFVGTPAYHAWRDNAFETASLSLIPPIEAALGIAGVSTKCFPWASSSSSPGSQVGLVIEFEDGITDLCEMRFTDTPLAIDAQYEHKLQHKRDVFREESGTKNAVHLVLVSVAGVERNVCSGCLYATIDADDLFSL